MTKAELKQALKDLEEGLGNFKGGEFVKRQDRILELKAKLASFALDDVVARLEGDPEFEVDGFRRKVEDVKDSIKSRKIRVEAFDKAINILSKVFGLRPL